MWGMHRERVPGHAPWGLGLTSVSPTTTRALLSSCQVRFYATQGLGLGLGGTAGQEPASALDDAARAIFDHLHIASSQAALPISSHLPYGAMHASPPYTYGDMVLS